MIVLYTSFVNISYPQTYITMDLVKHLYMHVHELSVLL